MRPIAVILCLSILAGCTPNVAKVRTAFVSTRDNAALIIAEAQKSEPDPKVIIQAAISQIKAAGKGIKAAEGTEDSDEPIVAAIKEFAWLVIGGAVPILLLWRRRWQRRVVDASWEAMGIPPAHFPKGLSKRIEKGRPP